MWGHSPSNRPIQTFRMPTTEATSSALLGPVESLTGVGPARAKVFNRLGVRTLGDLLEYFPRDYQYESSELPISRVVDNQIQTAVSYTHLRAHETGRNLVC